MIMSANRLLLQRIVATPALRQLGRRQASSCRAATWNSARFADSRLASQQLAAHFSSKNALFSSTSTQIDLPGENADESTNATDTEEPADDLNETNDGNQNPPEEMSTQSGDSPTEGSGEKSDVTPEEVSTKQGTDTAVGVTSNSAGRKNYNAVLFPLEEVIMTGTIKWIGNTKNQIEIVQDKKYRTKGRTRQRVFAQYIDFYPDMPHPKTFAPKIDKSRRIQFQTRLLKGSRSLSAFNIRYEGGGHIVMMDWEQVMQVMRKARATLGHEVYEILSSEAVENEQDMTKRIENAYERCSRKINLAKKQVTQPKSVAEEFKGKLGEEIYDLLTNIATVDNMEQRVDEAYMSCLKDLSVLELHFPPGEVFDDQPKEGGFQAFFERGQKNGAEEEDQAAAGH